MIVIIDVGDERRVGHGTGAECEQLAFEYLNETLHTHFDDIEDVRLYEEFAEDFLENHVDWPGAEIEIIAVDFFEEDPASPWMQPS